MILGVGEQGVLQLALERGADLVPMDESGTAIPDQSEEYLRNGVSDNGARYWLSALVLAALGFLSLYRYISGLGRLTEIA